MCASSEAAPMNSFPRNTSVHIEEWDAQWVFDTTSAKWTVGTHLYPVQHWIFMAAVMDQFDRVRSS